MAASHRPTAKAAIIPRYTLYDEPLQPIDPRFVHVETIASRSAPRDWTIRSHMHHDLHQLLLIADGGGQMRAESERWQFGAASLLIAPAGLVHGFGFEPGTRGHIVSFADALVRRFIATEPTLAALLTSARAATIGPAAALIDRQLARLARELSGGAALAMLASSALLSLILVAAARAVGEIATGTQASPGPQAALVARFRAQIEARIGEGWTVAQHALALGISGSRLRAACAVVAGQPPIRMIQDRTMIEARRLLAHGSAPVSAIGYALGFIDPAYFSRWFAAAEGQPPAAYRRALEK